MAPKQLPRCGAKSRASARPNPADDVLPTERRTKSRHDPAEQPGSSSAKRGRASSSGRVQGSMYPRRKTLDSSPEISEKSSSSSSSSSSESSQPTRRTPSKTQSKFRIIYPRLVQEFYQNLECTEEGYKSKVKGIVIDMPTDLAATIFKIPDEGEDYHNFEFNLHEAYTIMTGLPADESDPKQTHVTKFNTNTFPPVLRLTHHMLTTIITPQGGRRDRLTDIQRFVLYCMSKDIKINLHVIMYQIISETTRADLHRSLPYAAHLTQVFKHFGVSLENEKSEKIPKSNIYCFKHVQKFMGFRIVGDQVRRGPAAVEAPVAQEDQPPVQEEQPPVPEEQPLAPEDQPQVHEDQPHINEDQPHVADEVEEPFIAPHSPQPQPSSSMNLEPEIPSFSPPPPVQASSSFGGPSVPPELYTFLNDKFDALNTSIQSMSENFELRIQRLENSVSARFIEQKAASDHATHRFNRLIGTLADASVELKEHKKELEIVLKGILANSQADVFNIKETLSQISKTRLSFAHLVDDLKSMKNLSAHIDEEMSALKKEFKVLNRPGTNIFCKGSVDTTILGVDTMVQNKGRNVKKSPSQVNTSPEQVDTREPSQKKEKFLTCKRSDVASGQRKHGAWSKEEVAMHMRRPNGLGVCPHVVVTRVFGPDVFRPMAVTSGRLVVPTRLLHQAHSLSFRHLAKYPNYPFTPAAKLCTQLIHLHLWSSSAPSPISSQGAAAAGANAERRVLLQMKAVWSVWRNPLSLSSWNSSSYTCAA
ncbi:hypothetical protein Taro_005550 [Colocasia esculenta]|uniref:Putative plant transposon protein domain-containing protein n=1 Tax=Colocasia esculenta TaxID=4460 RepID=A0A843TUW9_COLES|nr:hypothetical protein [Colocasia esculenta]